MIDEKLKNLDNNFWKLEDFQELINDRRFNIEKPVDLLRFNKRLYNRAQYLKFLSKIRYQSKRYQNKYINFSMEDVQKEIDSLNISSKSELKATNQALYNRYKFLRKSSNSDLRFKRSGLSSNCEEKFLRILLKYGVKNFSTQYIIKGVKKNKRNVRYDFYLIDYNTIIEVHGTQHFNPRGFAKLKGETLDEIQENDKFKYESAKKKGFKIYYFTFEKSFYEKFGYFEKVYTDPIELLKLILNKPVLEENAEYNLDLDAYVDNKQKKLIKDAQEIINKNNACTREELRKVEPSVYYRMKKHKLLDKVIFKIPPYKKTEIDTRYMNSPEDINKELKKFGIKSFKEFRIKFYGLYQKMEKHGWKNEIKF